MLNGITVLDLASVGYDAATRFAPGFYWAHYHGGALALERQQYADAANQFAEAILSDPALPQAFLGLAVSAYYGGDLEVAVRAVDRAMSLEPNDPLVLRTAAFIAASTGNRETLDRVVQTASAAPAAAAELDRQRSRLEQLLRTAYVTQSVAGDVAASTAGAMHRRIR